MMDKSYITGGGPAGGAGGGGGGGPGSGTWRTESALS